MNERTEVVFVETQTTTHFLAIANAYKFNPVGRMQWLQRLAWRFLQWRGALSQAREPKIKYERRVIDPDKLIDGILRQQRELMRHYRRDGQRLIIGSDDYAELMQEMAVHQYITFHGDVYNGTRIMGLQVEVVPWMRGAVVLP